MIFMCAAFVDVDETSNNYSVGKLKTSFGQLIGANVDRSEFLPYQVQNLFLKQIVYSCENIISESSWAPWTSCKFIEAFLW